MDQNWKRGAACLGVLLALYLLLAFLIPFVKTAVFWFSFVFTLIAFGVAAYALYTAFLKKPDARSRFYGFPIAWSAPTRWWRPSTPRTGSSRRM